MNLTAGYPYFLINSGLPVSYPKLDKSIKTDIVIIGGGISGALTAYYLINAGFKCVVVDGRTIGLGSSCASTSLLQYELDKSLSALSKQIGFQSASRAYKLCGEAINVLHSISEKIKFKLFEKKESLYFAAYKKDKYFLQNEYNFRKSAGFEVNYLEEQEIQDRYNFFAPAGILSAHGATTDAYMFTHALLTESIENGLNVYDRTLITKIDYQRKSVKMITDKGHCINAKKVVNASGYEVTEFINKKIVTLSSTYAIATEQLDSHSTSLINKTMLWNTADPYLYIRSTIDNRIIIGGRDEEFTSAKKRDVLIKKKSQLLKRDLLKLYPQIEFETEFSWSGTFGSTKDALPYIGEYKKTPHTYYALGFGGNGITFSLIAAILIRDMLLGKKNSNAFLFSFDR